LATATNGSDGLQLFLSRAVDAVVLDYHLGLLEGAAIAGKIKQAQPKVPIVMVADQVELPADALSSVDALVIESDGPHFLLATVHFVLCVQPAQRREAWQRSLTPAHLRASGEVAARGGARLAQCGPIGNWRDGHAAFV